MTKMKRFMVFISATLLVLIISNIYVCFKYLMLLDYFMVPMPKWGTMAVFSLSAAVFLSSIFFQSWLSEHRMIDCLAAYTGAMYLGMLTYSLLLFLAADIVGIMLNFSPDTGPLISFFHRCYAGGIPVPAIAAAITGYGFYNARNFVVKNYEITINKQSQLDSLNIVMISDLHLGSSIKKGEIDKLRIKIKSLEPDIIFICGDMFDHGSHADLIDYAVKCLGSIKASLGTFFVTGNHEDYLGGIQQTLSYFKGSKIRVLADETVVAAGIYITGRKDRRSSTRAPLSKLLAFTDKNKPLILLDHQPNDILEAERCGVDLQLSGHTHNGQIFPFNFLVGMANVATYGLIASGSYNAVISSGCGTWKFPILTGSHSEIVNVRLHFGEHIKK